MFSAVRNELENERTGPMITDLQKASMWKRISAGLFDAILLVIVIVAAALMLSALTGYDGYSDAVSAAYEKYEQQYGVTFELTQEQYAALSEEELARYNEAYEQLCLDQEAMYAYNMVVNLTMLISSISIFVGYLIMEFIFPLLMGDGRTLGKKIFGLALMRTDEIRVTAPLLFIRTVLGKYTIETMVPVLLIVMLFFNIAGLEAVIILGLILLMQIILLIATRTNSAIHDVLAKTVVVDYASQRIFASEQELLEYKKKLHAERVARQEY